MKHFWKITTAILAIVIILLTQCNGGGGTIVKSDTVTTRDTIIVRDTTKVYTPKPYKVEITKEKPIPIYIEGKDVVKEADTAAILQYYYATVHYSDSVSVDHGTVIINDQISQNRIKQRQVTANLQREVITNTITNTVQEKKRNSVYVGLIGQGGNVPLAVGGSVMFLQKKGYGIEAGILRNTEGKTIYQGSLKLQLWRK